MYLEILHWIFFSISLLCFSILCIPQIRLNYLNKTNLLSIYFILLWIIADLSNGFYCISLNMSYVSIILPLYNTLLNFILLCQYFQYEKVELFPIIFIPIYITIIFFIPVNFISWIALFCYLLAPIFQFVKIYQKKSTNGLAKSTFLLLIFANITFFISEIIIILNVLNILYTLPIFPILLKSILLIFLYVAILLQFYFYKEVHSKFQISFV